MSLEGEMKRATLSMYSRLESLNALKTAAGDGQGEKRGIDDLPAHIMKQKRKTL
jgi:hypothetical protein